MDIACITDKKPLGLKTQVESMLIVYDEVFDTYFKGSSYDYSLDLYFRSSDPNKLQDDIDKLLTGYDDYYMTNVYEEAQMMRDMYTLIGIFLYGFIIVISLIGVTNIFNTITTNMELRKQEFAMLKSVGMTSKEFNRMIRLESVFMGTKSLLIGIPIGVALSYVIYYYFTMDMGMKYIIPVVPVVIAVAAVFLLITCIMKYSISKINKQNIIETIRNENI